MSRLVCVEKMRQRKELEPRSNSIGTEKALVLRACAILVLVSGAAMAQGRPGASLGEMCGGIAGIQCRQDLWCDPEPGRCNGADIAGACIEVPRFCTREYRPVLGCDGKSYGNDCERRANRAAKDRDAVNRGD